MQSEVAVEVEQPVGLARRGEADRRAEARVIGLGVRRDDGQTVDGTAQEHDHQLLARGGTDSARVGRGRGPGRTPIGTRPAAALVPASDSIWRK